MKKYLYRATSQAIASQMLKNPSEHLELRVEYISFFSSKHAFLWKIVSYISNYINGKTRYVKYSLVKDNKIVSYAEVTGWMLCFPFMSSNEVYIGSARTLPEERGRGYFPYLLCRIQDELPQKDFCMFVDEDNIASIRGVKKAGFRQYATLKKARFGIYLIDEPLSSY